MKQQGEAPKRIPGCESTNHDECYGELWQCIICGKTVCHAEGTDNDPDICDDCWVSQHQPTQVRTWPEPTVDPPDIETLQEWFFDSICEATDGCCVEHDGTCPHSHRSWFLELGLI